MLLSMLLFCRYIPELTQFFDNIVIIPAGKCAFALHQNGIGDAFESFLCFGIPEAVPQVEVSSAQSLSLFSLILNAKIRIRMHITKKSGNKKKR